MLIFRGCESVTRKENMILEHAHRKYPKQYEIVTNGNTLNAFVRRGYIKKGKYSEYPQVDSEDYITDWQYKGNTYKIEYFDGSIFPFVVKLIAEDK